MYVSFWFKCPTRTERLQTPSLTRLEFKPITSWSWQHISCPCDAHPNHWATMDLSKEMNCHMLSERLLHWHLIFLAQSPTNTRTTHLKLGPAEPMTSGSWPNISWLWNAHPYISTETPEANVPALYYSHRARFPSVHSYIPRIQTVQESNTPEIICIPDRRWTSQFSRRIVP